jgi:peptide/nickel transport system substrate-binding protein
MFCRRAAVAVAIVALGALASQTAVAQTLRVGINASDFATLDPHRATSTTDVGLVSWMFNGLVRFPPGSADPTKIEPDLAERWESSGGGKTWTFHLRKGVQFQGGYGEMTAHDVVYSLERAKSKGDLRVRQRLRCL